MKALVLITLLFSLPGFCADVLPELLPLKIKAIYIPGGFDNNDRAQVVIEGTLPNTCFKAGPSRVQLDVANKTLIVQAFAYKYRGECISMETRFQDTVNIGILPAMPMVVKDGFDNAQVGNIKIATAKTQSADDYLYAPLSEVYVDAKRNQVTFSGIFTDSCAQLQEVRVFQENSNVVTALPISTGQFGPHCVKGEFPFSKTVSLPFLVESRYLLHARSLDGQAINKLFSIGASNR